MPILQISGSNVEYLEAGRGEPLLLLHSSGSSSAQWRSLVERTSGRYRVMAPDLYGYGATAQWSGCRPFHLECEAGIVLDLLGRADGPAHVVGHSYGGAVALHVARSHPHLLRSLTLIEPVAFHLLKGIDAAALAEITEVAQGIVLATLRGEYHAGFATFVDYWNGPGAWSTIPADKRQGMAARLPKVVLDFHATVNEAGRLEDLRALTVPTLLLRGAASPLPTRRICELLARTLPDAQMMTIAHAGHMAPLTHREQVNAMVVAHVDTNSGQPSRGLAGLKNLSGTNTAGAARLVA